MDPHVSPPPSRVQVFPAAPPPPAALQPTAAAAPGRVNAAPQRARPSTSQISNAGSIGDVPTTRNPLSAVHSARTGARDSPKHAQRGSNAAGGTWLDGVDADMELDQLLAPRQQEAGSLPAATAKDERRMPPMPHNGVTDRPGGRDEQAQAMRQGGFRSFQQTAAPEPSMMSDVVYGSDEEEDIGDKPSFDLIPGPALDRREHRQTRPPPKADTKTSAPARGLLSPSTASCPPLLGEGSKRGRVVPSASGMDGAGARPGTASLVPRREQLKDIQPPASADADGGCLSFLDLFSGLSQAQNAPPAFMPGEPQHPRGRAEAMLPAVLPRGSGGGQGSLKRLLLTDQEGEDEDLKDL